MFYGCIMDKRNHSYLVLLWENPFFYYLDQIWVHLLVSQIPTGGTTDVGREYIHVILIFPMLYWCIMDKRNHFYLVYLVLLQENSFFYCHVEQIWVNNLLVSEIPIGESTYVGTECMHVIHFCPMFYICMSDQKYHFYFILLQVKNFFYCLAEQICVDLL
jgi:hypothetical protein